MHQMSLVLATLLKRSSPATCGRIRTSVYAREQPQSAYMRAHRASMFICSRVCMCVLLQGLCVRGVEHLNINNCHVGHLGPRSQLAPWAQSHHQHSCHRVQMREGSGGEEAYEGGSGRQETHTQLIVHIHLGMDLRDRNTDGHEQGDGFTCNFGDT